LRIQTVRIRSVGKRVCPNICIAAAAAVKYDSLSRADRKTGAVAKTPFRIAAASSARAHRRMICRRGSRRRFRVFVVAAAAAAAGSRRKIRDRVRLPAELNLSSSFGFIARRLPPSRRPSLAPYRLCRRRLVRIAFLEPPHAHRRTISAVREVRRDLVILSVLPATIVVPPEKPQRRARYIISKVNTQTTRWLFSILCFI